MNGLNKFLQSFKLKHDKKKTIEKIIIVLIIGVVFMVIGDFRANDNESDCKDGYIQDVQQHETSSPQKSLEKNMEDILGKIEGAGKVKVMITYKTSKEVVHQIEEKEVINDTKEEDGGGGIRITKQRELSPNVIFEEHNGAKQAVVKKEIEPLIKGVVVVAEGADDDNVRMNLQMAAKILTDIPIHKISVFVMEK